MIGREAENNGTESGERIISSMPDHVLRTQGIIPEQGELLGAHLYLLNCPLRIDCDFPYTLTTTFLCPYLPLLLITYNPSVCTAHLSPTDQVHELSLSFADLRSVL